MLCLDNPVDIIVEKTDPLRVVSGIISIQSLPENAALGCGQCSDLVRCQVGSDPQDVCLYHHGPLTCLINTLT